MRRGNCDWEHTEDYTDELTQLRSEDVDAWSFFAELVDMSKSPQGLLIGHHRSPLRVTSRHVLGELKSRASDGRQMYRLYYGEPDQRDNLVVGLTVAFRHGLLASPSQHVAVFRNNSLVVLC